MKTVVFVESGSGYGGSSVCLYNMLKVLKKNAFSPTVVYYSWGPNIEKIAKLGVRTHHARGIKMIFTLLALRIRGKCSLIHTNNDIYSHVPTILTAFFFRIPVITHIRSVKKLTLRERMAARFVRHFLCVSGAAQDKLIASGIKREKTTLLYDGIDTELFGNACANGSLRKELGVEASEKLVGLVSRFTEGKGIDYFIHAAHSVLRARKDVTFVIIGDVTHDAKNSFKDSLVRLVDTLGVRDKVRFLGWRRDVSCLYGAFDVVVNVSYLEESFGMTNVEAMASGAAVISTDIGAYKEVVIDRENGFLIPPKDAASLAEKIKVLLADEKLSKRMGEAGTARAQKMFDIKNTVAKLEDIYQKVLTKRSYCASKEEFHGRMAT